MREIINEMDRLATEISTTKNQQGGKMDKWTGIECHVEALSIMRERKHVSPSQKKHLENGIRLFVSMTNEEESGN